MHLNTVMAILFLSIAAFTSVAVYNDAKTEQTAVQNGLQQCVIKFDWGLTKAWQKDCPK